MLTWLLLWAGYGTVTPPTPGVDGLITATLTVVPRYTATLTGIPRFNSTTTAIARFDASLTATPRFNATLSVETE